MPPTYHISSRRHAELALASRLSGEERDQDNWSYLASSMKTEAIDAPYTFSPSASSAYDSPLPVCPQFDFNVDFTSSRPPSPLLLLTDAFAPLAWNSPTHAKGHRRRREPDYIPRPRNAYIMFRSYYIQTNCGSGKKKQDDISKIASNVWNNMTEEEKQPFIQAAFEEKIQHKLKYPDYKYKPGAPSAAPRTKSVKTKARVLRRIIGVYTSPSSLSPLASARATLDAPSSSSSSSCFSFDAHSPGLNQYHIPLSSISATQSIANDLASGSTLPSVVPTMASTHFNDFYNWGVPVDPAIANFNSSYLASFQYEPLTSEQLPFGDLGFQLGGYDDFQAYDSERFDLGDLIHMDRL